MNREKIKKLANQVYKLGLNEVSRKRFNPTVKIRKYGKNNTNNTINIKCYK